MNAKYVAILFGACLLAGGCVIESSGSVGGSAGAGNEGGGGTGGGGTAGGGTAGTGATGAMGGTGGSMGGTGGVAMCADVDGKCTVAEDCCTGSCDMTAGACLCNRCGEFVTPGFGTGPSLCPDNPDKATTDTTDFVAIIDCMCAAGEGCEMECKDTCPVGDMQPSAACVACAADFTKDVNKTCENQQKTCSNDL